MQRWGYAYECEKCIETTSATTSTETFITPPPPTPVSEHECVFRVRYNGYLWPNEHLAVVGNCSSLGDWNVNECVFLYKEEGDENIWSAVLSIRCAIPMEYRYLICAENPRTGTRIVRRWETHLHPRVVENICECEEKPIDEYGLLNGKICDDRGWLTSGTIIQFKLFNAPFRMIKPSKCPRLYNVKIKPVHLKNAAPCEAIIERSGKPDVLTSTSSDMHQILTECDSKLDPAFAFNEVAVLSETDSKLHLQPEYGTPCGPDDLVIFHFTIEDFRSTAFYMDVYLFGMRAARDEPPIYVAYQLLLPDIFKCSEGRIEVPITCSFKHRIVGYVTIDFLIVLPTPEIYCDMKLSYERYWNPEKTGLYVGHRGLGPNFVTANQCLVRENTIVSLKAAVEEGAHMVEFDVQLSKDMVPIVHHDFQAHFWVKARKYLKTMEIPIQSLLVRQLKSLKVNEVKQEEKEISECCFKRDVVEHLPFPTLEEVFEAIPLTVGFNIEIKWAQRLINNRLEGRGKQKFDPNMYVDIMLQCIFRHANGRRIILSCFDADICTLLRYKQNYYPVLFISQECPEGSIPFRDPRPNSLQTAVYNANAMELLGIVARTETILQDTCQVNMAINRGLHAILYDKMEMCERIIKDGVFQLQAEESTVEEINEEVRVSMRPQHPAFLYQ
ncbi:glycerophosphocholine phosphodiesterase GPCPD1-like isoform X2 [Teleopsis dalmanni]|uniref:glycerophosphocholine phosphodiesterase GPCPD1-like isoform X2 n=2 Tax=Teleopsis dalmanni TaxID=139649 RepID=UPI0018CDBF69|nr:glycerophosphocholine phosphodiesterase GPCPD1-like isoform X2 [Teleopsis dalmanni]